MATLDYKGDEKQKADERLDPYSDSARDLYKQEHESIPGYDRNDGLDDHPITAGDASGKSGGGSDKDSSTKNIDDAGAKEREGGNALNYTGTGGDNNQKPSLSPKDWIKKRLPIGVILAALLGGGMLAPLSTGGLLIWIQEKYTEKFNDQLAAMDTRTTKGWPKKFKGTTKNCGLVLTYRCKYNTMKPDKFQDLEKAVNEAGGKINKSGETFIRGRVKIDSIEYKGETIRASDFTRKINTDPGFGSMMFKGYNPKLAGHSDATFQKLAQKIGINKQKNISGATDSERRKSVIDSANGNKIAEADARVTSTEECQNGQDCKTVYKDEVTGEVISQEEYDDRIGDSSALKGELDARKTLSEAGASATTATLKGALTSTSLGLGSVDSACSGYTLIRTVAFAAKYLGALQLLRYAYVFMNTGSGLKAMAVTPAAQQLTPEEIEYAGKIITTPNREGKTATDTYGYKYAVDGDVPPMPRSDDLKVEGAGKDGNNIQLSAAEKQRIEINDETTKYINGQLVSESLLASIIKLTGSSGTTTSDVDDVCGFVKSGWGQTIVIGASVLGAVIAFFSGGLTLGWGIGAQIAVSAAISVAIAMLTPKLIDMAAGTMIGNDELTNGNRTGNAMTSGMGSYNDQTSAARGVPALKTEDAPAYEQLVYKTQAKYAAIDRVEHSPLDPTNPNTFMGSFVSKILPFTSKMSNLGSSISNVTQFATSSFASIIPTTHAQDMSAQFKICEDRDYKEVTPGGVAADPFCNIQHGLDGKTLDVDPETVIDFMESRNYTNEETGLPKEDDNDYATYIKNCMDRSVSIGGFTEDNENKGVECIQGSASKTPHMNSCLDNSEPAHTNCVNKLCKVGNANDQLECTRNMFRLHFIDYSIQDGQENGFAPAAVASQTSSAAPAECQSMAANDLGQIACHAYQFDNYGYLWGGGHSGTAEGFMSKFKSGGFTAGKDSVLDCSGLVRMAIYDALQIDIGGLATGAYPSYNKFKEVSKQEAKAGDILWKSGPGHTELVVSNDPAAQKWQTFGAHTADTAFEKQISPTTYSYSGFTKVYRFQP